MKVLCINTYAGSLLIGAKAVGAEVIGSYEDKKFGQGIPRLNFPNVKHVATTKEWPKQNLSDVFVIAHPPCSAFSVQNCSPSARGPDSAAFACTKQVLDYAMENGALGVAIESVMGALAGAWPVHQQYADTYGYNLYRILENGCAWGCQWRERFWAVWLKKGAAPEEMPFTITPQYLTVQEVIRGYEYGPSAGNQDVLLERQKIRLIEEAKLTDADMAYLFNPPPHHPTKALGNVLYEYKFKKPDDTPEDRWDIFTQYIGGFASGTMVYLDPNGLAPTVMGGSHWYINGRNLSEDAFKCIMGFPPSYQFPTRAESVDDRNYKSQIRMYLSKGVMPPIAQWILEEVGSHLGWKGHLTRQVDLTKPSYQLTCMPNSIADFRIRKDDWYERHSGLPPLRTEETKSKARVIAFKERPPKPERATKPPKYQSHAPIPRTKLSESRITVNLDFQLTTQPGSVIEKKRHKIVEMLKELKFPTRAEAIEHCCKHPDLQILPTTMHWHMQQLIKQGMLREATIEEVALYLGAKE